MSKFNLLLYKLLYKLKRIIYTPLFLVFLLFFWFILFVAITINQVENKKEMCDKNWEIYKWKVIDMYYSDSFNKILYTIEKENWERVNNIDQKNSIISFIWDNVVVVDKCIWVKGEIVENDLWEVIIEDNHLETNGIKAEVKFIFYDLINIYKKRKEKKAIIQTDNWNRIIIPITENETFKIGDLIDINLSWELKNNWELKTENIEMKLSN